MLLKKLVNKERVVSSPSQSKNENEILSLLNTLEKALETEKRYKAILESMMEGFQVIDFEWRYVFVNNTLVKQGRYPREKLIGKTMMEIYPGIEQTEMFSKLKISMEKRIPQQFENEFTFPDGTVEWFELSMQPTTEGVSILSMDITKRKKAEHELVKLNQNLERQVKQRTAQLEEKNRDIVDSINYAKNIQQAFLPDKTELPQLLPESFIFHSPKDTLSGDFYWFKKRENEIILAVADCTGHGVPGALVSIIGSQKLSDAVAEGMDTSKILNQLNRDIKTCLRQSEGNGSSRDGMDIAICAIDTEKRTVKYAGANIPFLLMRNGQNEVEKLNGTRRGIGGVTEDETFFETHTLQLQPGDTFYLSSDGYADQDGGERGKKLMRKKFRKLLLDIQNKSMPEQETHLRDFAEKWRGDKEQLDDILVVGVRL